MKNKNNFIIGTANIGQKYGIINPNNLLLKKNAVPFIEKAIKLGFKSFDTARAYGNSELILGECINNKKNIKIYTKIPTIIDNNPYSVEKSFRHSLKNLKKKKIQGLFLHNAQDWHKEYIKKISEKLLKLKYIKEFGLSIYDPSQIFNHQNINLIQIPGSIFNQKMLKNKKIYKFHANGGTVIVRSIFIQGIILNDLKNLPMNLHSLKEPIEKFQLLAKKNDLSPDHLAIAVIKELCPYAKIIIGCENIQQLISLNLFSESIIDKSILYSAIDLGQKYSSKLWDPRFWL